MDGDIQEIIDACIAADRLYWRGAVVNQSNEMKEPKIITARKGEEFGTNLESLQSYMNQNRSGYSNTHLLHCYLRHVPLGAGFPRRSQTAADNGDLCKNIRRRSALRSGGVHHRKAASRRLSYNDKNRRFMPYGSNNLHIKHIFFGRNYEKYVKNADFLKKFKNPLELFGFIG